MNQNLPLCLCGCGLEVSKITNRYISGHATKGKSSWNKGKSWPDEIKKKFSISQKLRHPDTFAGKTHSDETKKKISDSWNINRKIRSNNISIATKGKLRSQKTKEKISIGHKGIIPWSKGKKLSLEHRRKLSEAGKGKKLSEQTKLKIRLTHLKNIQEKFFNGESIVPCIGKKEKEFIHFLKSNYNDIILTQFQTKCGYFIDCYIPSINVAFEFDENHHESEACKKYDDNRQKLIQEELSCLFYRVREQDWDSNKNKVVSEVKSFLEQNIKEK